MTRYHSIINKWMLLLLLHHGCVTVIERAALQFNWQAATLRFFCFARRLVCAVRFCPLQLAAPFVIFAIIYHSPGQIIDRIRSGIRFWNSFNNCVIHPHDTEAYRSSSSSSRGCVNPTDRIRTACRNIRARWTAPKVTEATCRAEPAPTVNAPSTCTQPPWPTSPPLPS